MTTQTKTLFAKNGPVIIFLQLIVLACTFAYPSAYAAHQPNVVVIMADDIGYDEVGPYKPQNSPIPTPNIDRLANEGMIFTDANTPGAACSPTRYSILTGNYPYRGKVRWGVWNFNEASMIRAGQKTIGQVMRSTGYKTAFFGKWGIGGDYYNVNGDYFYRGSDFTLVDYYRGFFNGPRDNGFDYSFVLPDGIQRPPYAYFENDRYVPIDPQESDMIFLPKGPYLNGRINYAGYGDPNWDSSEVGPNLANKAAAFINQHHAQNLQNGTSIPFFMLYESQAIHGPLTPPATFNGQPVAGVTGAGAMGDMTYELDLQVGLIISTLEALNLADDTLFIFTSDNGGWDANPPFRSTKGRIYEGGHRVPFIAKWGDGTQAGSYIQPGVTSTQTISVLDIMATMYDLTDQDMAFDEAYDSANLLPILLGQQSDSDPLRDYMIIQAVKGDGITDYWGGIRQGPWTLLINRDGIAVELYNLDNDIAQTTNLINNSQYTGLAQQMFNQYNAALNPSARTVPAFINNGISACGAPVYDGAIDSAIFLWQDCATEQWYIRITAGSAGSAQYIGNLTSDLGFTSVVPYNLEAGDILDTSNPNQVNFSLQMVSPWDDGFDFVLPTGSNACLTVDTPAGAVIHIGAGRYLVNEPLSLQTLGPCTLLSPTLNVGDVLVSEDTGIANFTVTLSPASTSVVTVDFATADGTATAPADYTALSTTTLTFNPGEASKTVPVSIVDDGDIEGTETFTLNLSNATNASIEKAIGTGTITDNDISVCGAPNIDGALDGTVFLWQDCATGQWSLRATAGIPGVAQYIGNLVSDLSFTSITPVSLEIGDILDTSNPNRINFNLQIWSPWDDGFDFTLPVGANACLSIETPSGATVLVGASRSTITTPFSLETLGSCDAPSSTLSINNVTVTEGDGTADFTATLSPASTQTVTVDATSTNGSATAPDDYVALPLTTLTFTPGETSKTLLVFIVDDILSEGSENFNIILSNAVNATVTDNTGVATILDNEVSACGAPAYDPAVDSAIFLWLDCGTGQWFLRATAGVDGFVQYIGIITSDLGFTSVVPVNLEANDIVNTSDPGQVAFTLQMENPWIDGFDFRLPGGTNTCLSIQTPGTAEILVGTDRTAVATPFNLVTLGACIN